MCEGYSSCLSVTTQCQCIPETNDTHGFLCWILTREVLNKYIRAHCEPFFLDQQNTDTTLKATGRLSVASEARYWCNPHKTSEVAHSASH